MVEHRRVVIVGAGPCGLAALKELREAGHDAIALDKGPGIGGVFCRTHDTQYDNLYLTISNLFMAFSDFPPEPLRIKYSSKDEYGRYLEAYADAFELRPHIRLATEVLRATRVEGRWRITTRRVGGSELVEIEADALIVATGANHVPRRIALPGFTGRVMHSSEFRRPEQLAGQRVLVVGSGESAFDISADLCGHAAAVTVWSRSPIAPAPRFSNWMPQDPDHDELEVMRDEAQWSRAKVSDFLEVMTTSRMANAAPMWAYSTIRHGIFAICRVASPAARRLSVWNRQMMAGEPLLGDQVAVPTKSARLCTEAARGRLQVIVAEQVAFAERRASFSAVRYAGNGDRLDEGPGEATIDEVDVVVLCTGYQTDFAWLEVEGLDWNPRTWFKHCFPPGLGDALMFLGWARPHQGGIPACAELLARYIALILAGERTLPADYAERARIEGEHEHAFYVRARHAHNLVDYPSFMDSVARLIGCLPTRPGAHTPERLAQYWMYPGWPLWYRMQGPGARPELVEQVLRALPLRDSFRPDPFNVMALGFSLLQAPIAALVRPRPGFGRGWSVAKAKRHILHGNGT